MSCCHLFLQIPLFWGALSSLEGHQVVTITVTQRESRVQPCCCGHCRGDNSVPALGKARRDVTHPRSHCISEPSMPLSNLTPPCSAQTNGALARQCSILQPAFPSQVMLQKAAKELSFLYHLHIAGRSGQCFINHLSLSYRLLNWVSTARTCCVRCLLLLVEGKGLQRLS